MATSFLINIEKRLVQEWVGGQIAALSERELTREDNRTKGYITRENTRTREIETCYESECRGTTN